MGVTQQNLLIYQAYYTEMSQQAFVGELSLSTYLWGDRTCRKAVAHKLHDKRRKKSKQEPLCLGVVVVLYVER